MNFSTNTICRPAVVMGVFATVLACYYFIDLPVTLFFHQYPALYTSPIIRLVSLPGSWPVMLTLLILIFALLRIKAASIKIREVVLLAILTLVSANSVALIVKMMVGRARPMLWFDAQLFGFYGPTFHYNFWSFPSGHAISVMSVLWACCIYHARLTWLWLTLGLILIASRIVLLKHFISDVTMSVYIALVICVVLYQQRDYWKRWI